MTLDTVTQLAARIDEVIKAIPGVGSGPTSSTSTPIEQIPATSAFSII